MIKHKCKIIVVGAKQTGKTSFLKKYVYDFFPLVYNETHGINYGEKYLAINNQNLLLEIWDIAGNELNGCYNKIYCNGVNVAIVFIDITNENTLNTAIEWKKYITNECDKIPFVLVANKCDLDHHFITDVNLIHFSNEFDFLACIFVSVKNNINVASVMKLIIKNYSNVINCNPSKMADCSQSNITECNYSIQNSDENISKRKCCLQ
jgi:small GTP-binding protein